MENFYGKLAEDPFVIISEKEILLEELSYMNTLMKNSTQNDDGTIRLYYDDWNRMIRILVSVVSRMD